MKKALSSLLVVLALAFTAVAQNTIRIAADSSSGTYSTNLGQLVDRCSDNSLDVQSIVGNPPGANGGAVGNLDFLYNNKADAAFMHSDVYIFNAQADPSYNKFKTLAAFWPEPIHILVLSASKSSKHGTFSFGKMTFNNLSDLNGYTVAAAGGGVLTSKLLSGMGGGNFNVKDSGTGKQVIADLDSGAADAAIFVGASPLPNLQQLPNKGNYRLIPVGDQIAGRVSNVYRPVKINYPGLTSGPIATIAPLATLISKPFNTPTKIEAQKKLRACLAAKLGDLQDNGSPNWQEVVANDHGIATIPWLELPGTPTVTTTPITRKRRP